MGKHQIIRKMDAKNENLSETVQEPDSVSESLKGWEDLQDELGLENIRENDTIMGSFFGKIIPTNYWSSQTFRGEK